MREPFFPKRAIYLLSNRILLYKYPPIKGLDPATGQLPANISGRLVFKLHYESDDRRVCRMNGSRSLGGFWMRENWVRDAVGTAFTFDH